MAESSKPIGRTSDQYKIQKPTSDSRPDPERPPADEPPGVDENIPRNPRWNEERRREERGNRGPAEEPGFGQGA